MRRFGCAQLPSVGSGSMSGVIPGEVIVGDGALELNAGKPVTVMIVVNAGDRPVQVGSHFHFAESNAALEFDRHAAWGRRLDIPAGTAARFEPGIEREIALVPFGGERIVRGLRGLSGGPLNAGPPSGVDLGGALGDDGAPVDGSDPDQAGN